MSQRCIIFGSSELHFLKFILLKRSHIGIIHINTTTFGFMQRFENLFSPAVDNPSCHSARLSMALRQQTWVKATLLTVERWDLQNLSHRQNNTEYFSCTSTQRKEKLYQKAHLLFPFPEWEWSAKQKSKQKYLLSSFKTKTTATWPRE